MRGRRKGATLLIPVLLGYVGLGAILGAPSTIALGGALKVANKIECHMEAMLLNRVAALAASKQASAAGSVDAAATEIETEASTLSKASTMAAKDAAGCGGAGGTLRVIQQACQVLTDGSLCTPQGLARALCEKASPCKASAEFFAKTRNAITGFFVQPFKKAWAAVRGKPLPVSPTALGAASDKILEAQTEAETTAPGSDPTIENASPAAEDLQAEVVGNGGGTAEQAAGETTRGAQVVLSDADIAAAAALAEGGAGVAGEAVTAAAEQGAAKAAKLGTAVKFGSVALRLAPKLLGWAGWAWMAYAFVSDLIAPYQTPEAITSAGMHYYGAIDVLNPNGYPLATNAQAPTLEKLAPGLLGCQTTLDLQAQVLGDPTSNANAEFVGSFVDPTSTHPGEVREEHRASPLGVGPSIKAGTYSVALRDVVSPEDGPGDHHVPLGAWKDGHLGSCDLPTLGAGQQPREADWAAVLQAAVVRDLRLAGVPASLTTVASGERLTSDGHAYADWTLDDLATFGLGTDIKTHYGSSSERPDQTLVNGVCASTLALTPAPTIVPRAYSDLLRQMRRGDFAAYSHLRQVASGIPVDNQPRTHDCILAPMDATGALQACITQGFDPLNTDGATFAVLAGHCSWQPIWKDAGGTVWLPARFQGVDVTGGHAHVVLAPDGPAPLIPDQTLTQALDGIAASCDCSPPGRAATSPRDAIDLGAAATSAGFVDATNSLQPTADGSPSATDVMDRNVEAMVLAVCDVYGTYSPTEGANGADAALTPLAQDPSRRSGGAGGGIGCGQMTTSEFGKAMAQAPAADQQALDPTDAGQMYEALALSLSTDLAAAGGDIDAAFARYVRDNHLAPQNGTWHNTKYVPGQTSGDPQAEPIGDWSSELAVGAVHVPRMPSSLLLTTAYSDYLLYLDNPGLGNQDPVDTASLTITVPLPSSAVLNAMTQAASEQGVPMAVLLAMAHFVTNGSFTVPGTCTTLPDQTLGCGLYALRFADFNAARGALKLTDAQAGDRIDPRFDQPEYSGEVDIPVSSRAFAWVLRSHGLTASSSAEAVTRFIAGYLFSAAPAAACSAGDANCSINGSAQQLAATWVARHYEPYANWFAGGSAVSAGAVQKGGYTLPCLDVRQADRCDLGKGVAPALPWVPAPQPGGSANSHNGFENALFSQPGDSLYQCTYWAKFNANLNIPPGNGGDWYRNAVAAHLPTRPASEMPMYGSIVSFAGLFAGHVAVVVAVDTVNSRYEVSEMNVIYTDPGAGPFNPDGTVDLHWIRFPTPNLNGSIVPPEASAWATAHPAGG